METAAITPYSGMSLFSAILLWWLGTGAVMLLGRALAGPGSRAANAAFKGWPIWAAVLALGIGVYAVVVSAADASSGGAYLGFIGALAVWGFIEATFLAGWVTGPRRAPCPEGAFGWKRFRFAAETLIYHEILIAASVVAVFALTRSGVNDTAFLTILALAVLRLSAKLNLFFGVPNFSDELMPAHLGYLRSYCPRRHTNMLAPVSILLPAMAAAMLAATAAEAPTPVGRLLVAALVALGTLEHIFMFVPFRDAVLWRWAGVRSDSSI